MVISFLSKYLLTKNESYSIDLYEAIFAYVETIENWSKYSIKFIADIC